MKRYKSNSLEFAFSDTWETTEDENLISVYDPKNGLGALQFTLYEVDPSDEIDLISEFEDYLGNKHEGFTIDQQEGHVYSEVLDEDEVWWRYWLFLRGETLIFATYDCANQDRGKEDREVDKIIKSAIS